MATVTRPQLLAPLAADDLTARQATALVRQVLNDNPEAAQDVYRAFRAWSWKTLTGRRYDAELRAWHDLLRKTAAAVGSRGEDQIAARILALGELVYESVQFGEHERVNDVLQRSHVQTILSRVGDASELERRALQSATGLKSANLSRVLSTLISAGLVERLPRGREAAYRLTRRGQESHAELRRSRPAPASDHTVVSAPMKMLAVKLKDSVDLRVKSPSSAGVVSVVPGHGGGWTLVKPKGRKRHAGQVVHPKGSGMLQYEVIGAATTEGESVRVDRGPVGSVKRPKVPAPSDLERENA